MQVITLDFETYYDKEYSLRKMTTQEYVLDERFEVIMVSIKVGKEKGTCYIGQEQVENALRSIDWGNTVLVAQNALFDVAILTWHYNIRPKLIVDTLSMSRALYPHERSHGLAKQAERHGLKEKGTAVTNASGLRLKDFAPHQLQEYSEYCIDDGDITYSLFELYAPRFSRLEIQLIDATIRCYTEPKLFLDRAILLDHESLLQKEKERILQETKTLLGLKEATDEELSKKLRSNQQFADLLDSMGVQAPKKISPTTGKETFAFAKTDKDFQMLVEHPDLRVQTICAARLNAKSTIEQTRTQRFLDAQALSPKIPIPLRYYGAWTGRWSADSSGATNFQNLPRESEIKKGIKAPKGYTICGGDLSNIELRMGLYQARQDDKVKLIRQGLDLYRDYMSKYLGVPYDDVTKVQRQASKVINLSAIYGTGWAKNQDSMRLNAKQLITEGESRAQIDQYRADNPKVVYQWKFLGKVLEKIVNKIPITPIFDGLVIWSYEREGFLLPNGLYLQLPGLKTQINEEGREEFVFKGRNGWERTYGSKVFQGLIQALSRCIIAEGWIRVKKRYPVVLSVHDSLYWLAPEEEAEEALLWGLREMVRPVSWAKDLPLNAEGTYGDDLKGSSKEYKV